VIFNRATNERAAFAQDAFTDWLAAQLQEGAGWDEIATTIVTATGDVREQGATGLIFAHEGDPSEVASEVARVFLGIQIQCANCHDHPSDRWKREDFHELAAFFPRVGVRPKRDGDRQIGFEVVSVNPQPGRGAASFAQNRERIFRFLDKNRDGKLTQAEATGTPLANNFELLALQLDADKDGTLSLKELAAFRLSMAMPGRGSAEHSMPNLDDPASRGTQMDPVYFVNGESLPAGRSDGERRAELARLLTSPESPWFARAFVSRIWAELLGQGFYAHAPVDDIGPEREPVHPQVLDLLCQGFVANGHDVKWLFRAITATDAYRRQIRPADPTASVPFAAAEPTRLRSDQLYNALNEVFGIAEPTARPGGPGGGVYRRRSPRDGFNELFGFDPSTPQADLTGTVPQALFLMNSPQINALIEASARTRLGQLLDRFEDDGDALAELYLLVLAREPSAKEAAICREHIAGAKDRGEAFEDILWSLLNSTEFLTKR
jgi:hypothetical protein